MFDIITYDTSKQKHLLIDKIKYNLALDVLNEWAQYLTFRPNWKFINTLNSAQ